MKIAFLQNAHRREQLLASALRRGMARHKDKLEIVPYADDPHDLDCDAIAFIGMKCWEWHQHCRSTGKQFLYFDKGYYYPKEKEYSAKAPVVQCWRVAVDATQPLEYLSEAGHSSKRWDGFGPRPKPWREPTPDGHILLAGSSMKYHQFHGLPHPTAYFEEIVRELRQHTDRPIHYRPKPSWRQATPIDGTEFVPSGSFEFRAKGAHAIITHGSNAALIGMLMGVPSVILGNGVMRLISSTELSAIETPRLASEDERLQLLANLAWSQYTLAEFANGTAWHNIKTLFLQ
jgi:hypothetical protein